MVNFDGDGDRHRHGDGMCKQALTLMPYFHCRTWIWIRTRIPVLCRIFPLVQIKTLIP